MKFKVGDYVRFVGYNLSEEDYEDIKDILIKDKIYKIIELIRTPLNMKYFLRHLCENGEFNGLGEQHYERVINITPEQKQRLKDMINSI